MSFNLKEVRRRYQCGKRGCDCERPKGNIHCPVPTHLDENPSCNVGIGRNQEIVLKCFSGCTQEQVWDAISGERVVVSENTDTSTQEKSRYWYTDENVKKLFCVDRFYDSGGRKRFRLQHVCNSKLVPDMGGDCGCADVPRVLYNLPNVTMHNQVFWVEGEKDVETLKSHRAVATCTPQGSQSFSRCLVSNPTLLDPLRNKEIFIIADNDTAGERYAREVSERLMHYATKVWMLSFGSDYEPGYDITDYLSEPNRNFKEFVVKNKRLIYDEAESGDLIDILPPYSVNGVGDLSMAFQPNGESEHLEVIATHIDPTPHGTNARVSVLQATTATGRKSTILPSTRTNLSDERDRDGLVRSLSKKRSEFDWHDIVDKAAIAVGKAVESYGSVVDLAEIKPVDPRKNWLVEPLLGHNEHIVLYSNGGVGKSLLAGAIASSVALGEEVIPGIVPHASNVPTLYLDWEDSEGTWASRMDRMLNGLAFEGRPSGVFKYQHMKYPMSEKLDAIRRDIDRHGIELVVVDSIGTAVGDINKPDVATRYQGMVHAMGCAVLSITHVAKPQIGIDTKKSDPLPIGSVYFINGPRGAFFLAGDGENTIERKNHVIIQTKSNSGPVMRPIGYEAVYDNEHGFIMFNHIWPQENPKFREFCKPVDVLEHYLTGNTYTIQDLKDLIPDYKENTIGYTLQYYKERRFRELGDGYWTATAEPTELQKLARVGRDAISGLATTE